MASLEWSVDRLAAFLDRYPNTVVDLAARMGQMQFSVVRKIYSGNAERWFGNPWQAALLHLQESK